MNGIICVYKPVGFTSFDVIAIIRRLLGTKKVGHSGTLDPLAEGVLPVFAGAATKAVDYCPDTAKEYRASFKIGITTDTQDISGTVLTDALSDVLSDFPQYIPLVRIEEAAAKFIGEIEQIPPMYSAVKVGGKRLYKMAREGKEIERRPRKVTIHSLVIEEFGNFEGIIKVSCSKGTYIRTLIHDIGQALGFGAVMTGLQRTRSNGFTLDDCHTLEELRELHAQSPDRLESLLKPLGSLFDYPKGYLDERQTEMFRNGVVLNADLVRLDKVYEGVYSLYDSQNRIVALAKIERDHSISIMQRFNYS